MCADKSEIENLINTKHLKHWEKTLCRFFNVVKRDHHRYVFHKGNLINKYSIIKEHDPFVAKAIVKVLIAALNN